MKSVITNFWRRPLMTLVLIFVLSLVLTTAASADSPLDELQWVTICHKAPTMSDNPQTMTIYWSVLDTCLTEFNDYMGACMAEPAK